LNRIIISVTNDLTTDQRVAKTCDCFNELGYDILLIGRKIQNSLKYEDHYKTIRFRLLFNTGFLFYAEFNTRLFFKLLFSKKDLLLANDLDTLLPNYLISKLFSKKLVYDTHEYFTEVPELVGRKRTRSFWLFIEKIIFSKLKNVITVNDELAAIYSQKYHVPVTVIKNVPFDKHFNDSRRIKYGKPNQKVIIYQGSLNMGRGLELMIDTIPHLKNCILVIIGDGYMLQELKSRVVTLALQEKVLFLGKVLPKDLHDYTKNADLGISLEEDLGLNYRYALPNKLFDYIQAGIPVIASDLPLFSKMLTGFKVGEILKKRDPKSLSSLVEYVISNKAIYIKPLKEASNFYNWNNEKKVLIEFIKKID
jgi:glycosyltransferase involved in cell wall biosynthesis